ncbi:WD repeat-containing protein 91-like [Pogoniulus pusillus]|uniref:WD repeat-containing protein 91-like n=1 Tax=Pogoniulus pusillus TaxID=488313 RepID=UPI0030B94DF5
MEHQGRTGVGVNGSGQRVASLDVGGGIKVWSLNPILQAKASCVSRSPLLSLGWAKRSSRLLLPGSRVRALGPCDTAAKRSLCAISTDEAMPRSLSLACSPSGASCVCSAAAPSPISHVDISAVSSGGKSMNQTPGKLLLCDTKTRKQQGLLQFSLEPEPIAIHCTAFNHKGNLLLLGAADGTVGLLGREQKHLGALLASS